jgi:2-hydroxy-6-oxonona-2,4-dienedioate hydrolase
MHIQEMQKTMTTQRSVWQELGALPHEISYVQIGPWSTRVLTAGQGSETVVLIAGTSGHLEAHAWNLKALSANFRVIAYDSPGHGYTSLAKADLEIADYTEHLLGLLDAFGIDKAHIAGESLGGWIAAKFAAAHPDRVLKVILNAPGGTMLPAARLALVRQLSQAAVNNPTEENVRERLELVMASPASVTDELVAIRRAIYSQPAFAESMRHILCLQDPEIRRRNLITDAEFAAIPNEALVVWTTEEPSGPDAVGRGMAAKIPKGEFLMIENAAHWPQWEQPELYNTSALEFLTK